MQSNLHLPRITKVNMLGEQPLLGPGVASLNVMHVAPSPKLNSLNII